MSAQKAHSLLYSLGEKLDCTPRIGGHGIRVKRAWGLNVCVK